MNADSPRQADRDQIGRFVAALFRYADDGTYVSLRAFYDDANAVFGIQTHRLSTDLAPLVDEALDFATRAAGTDRPVVFAPPIATFSNARGATEADLENGLALSVECDQRPDEARMKLEGLLGPATIIVASGGEWHNPETGELEPKLHLHWRLTEPTRETVDHAKLKSCRSMAKELVGADGTSTPMVHPMRWPGSWHRKATPRLVRIMAETEAELDLSDAEQRLREAWAARRQRQGRAGQAGSGPSSEGEARDTAELIRAIVTGTDYHAPITALAMRYLKGGMLDAQAVLTLRGLMEGVPPEVRDTKDDVAHPGRWQSRYDDIPRAVRTARAEIDAETAKTSDWPDPVDFLSDDMLTGAPRLRPRHLPEALGAFVFDTAERMGVDPTAVALAALVTCSSVSHERWRIQPKRHDETWTEAARIWGAIVGDPSILKTPVIAACTRPIEHLEMEARREHASAIARYKTAAKTLKDEGGDPGSLGPAPRCSRYLVEGTTIEALSEVLRDDEQAHHQVPTGRVLIRQDEMSEWIASFDRYRSGSKGGSDRGAYLRLYNGGRYVVDRVGRGSFAVPSWSACVLGGIQPGPIQRIAQEAADDGLLQRFIYCVATRQDEGRDQAPDRLAIGRYERVIESLVSLVPMPVSWSFAPCEAPPAGPVVLQLSEAAHRYRGDINDLARSISALPDTSARLKAALGKWPGLFARLTLLFHLIDAADGQRDDEPPQQPDLTVGEHVAARVAALMRDVLLPHLLRAEALMFATAQTGDARWIAGYILSRESRRLALRDIVQAYHPLRAPEQRRELLDVMESLVAMGWLTPEPQANSARPPSAWLINPAIYKKFSARAETERMARAEAVRAMGERLRGRGAPSA
ncbi:DUF3987 domain-containing protein [Neoroseomonas oryzicola]|uniref:DUF3987 domain-containing protein n=1 Tax=Neoroseomonas oryzicola TaxID=535904 RepID=A0A9X9WEE5_9PROT|nr:DUF3987 domain-containing protein [Neoroseomonas oryzicola]MBR0658705.1 DUF3987 domain-containing protein [Neoroseomonas oryzicola]NKE17859.1 DUF3987 domain-containing protein [Neoroseomonas oryzicola]